MDLANIFLRHLDTKGPVYAPYSFEGNWTDEEKLVIKQAIFYHVPERVEATFNNWMFWKHDGWFSAKRATWDMVWAADTVELMAAKVAAYYTK